MQPPSRTPPAADRGSLRALGLEGLRELVLSRGLPEYRFRQIARWLFDKGAETFDEMTDLPNELRGDLARDYDLGSIALVSRQDSRVDGSSKYLFRLRGGDAVESVFMPAEKRVTLCISSQVGCTLDCVFCQTGRMGFRRNLEAHEIVEQIVPLWRRARGSRTRTNIVFMGMGEPLHNVREVILACRLVGDTLGFQAALVIGQFFEGMVENAVQAQLTYDGVYLDCDADTVLLKVNQVGGAACHEGYRSCFFRRVEGESLQVEGERVFDPKQVYQR